MARRPKKPTKPGEAYTQAEVIETATYANLVAALPSLPPNEALRLTRLEIDARWTDLNRAKVNKAVDVFRAKLAALGVVGKTLKIVTVTDRHGNYYYDVRTEAGGRKQSDNELLPTGYLNKKKKVQALAD